LPLHLRRTVTSGEVRTDGTFVLNLGSATLTVSPDAMYEAWKVRGPGGLLIVYPPGGEYVAVRVGARQYCLTWQGRAAKHPTLRL